MESGHLVKFSIFGEFLKKGWLTGVKSDFEPTFFEFWDKLLSLMNLRFLLRVVVVVVKLSALVSIFLGLW